MYHFYKAFAENDEDLIRRQQEYANEEHGVIIPYTTILTLSPRFFRDELELGLSICGDDDFLKYSAMMEFSVLVFNPLLDLLEEYAKVDEDGAREAAEEMIRILRRIDTNDDTFPEEEIRLIREAAGEGRRGRQ